MATLADIAEKANLSITTVSRVLNLDKNFSVSNQTKRRIFEIAEDLNYTKFKTKNSKTDSSSNTNQKLGNIGIIRKGTDSEELNDVYYLSIRIGAEKRCKELGYNLVSIGFDDELQNENLSGCIAIGNFSEVEIKKLKKNVDNLCVIGASFPTDDFDAINTDFYDASIKALEYLYNLGHRKIAFIGAERTDSMYGYRPYKTPTVNGYLDYMNHRGIFDENYFIVKTNSGLDTETGIELAELALEKWKGNLPTAILAANDAMAIGINRTILSKNILIPDDISLMGINDIIIAQYLTPSLTTVKVYTNEAGEIGVDTLHNRIINPTVFRRVQLTTEIVERESVRKLT